MAEFLFDIKHRHVQWLDTDLAPLKAAENTIKHLSGLGVQSRMYLRNFLDAGFLDENQYKSAKYINNQIDGFFRRQPRIVSQEKIHFREVLMGSLNLTHFTDPESVKTALINILDTSDEITN